MKKLLLVLSVLVAGFIGGMVGSILMHPSAILAETAKAQPPRAVQPLNIYNELGKRVVYLGPGQISEGTFYIYDNQHNIRLQAGSYVSGREAGQSYIGLHDRKQRLRLLLRLNGHEDSPVLVFKDTYGRDRLVLGLDGRSEDPFIRIMDKNGIPSVVVGQK